MTISRLRKQALLLILIGLLGPLYSGLCIGAKWHHEKIPYGNDTRQWLNIAKPNTSKPAGIVFWAHSNGGSPNSLSQQAADAMLNSDFAVVSWNSISKIQSPKQVQTAWTDAQLTFDFILQNAPKWQLNPQNVIIYGRSRGSLVSWPLAQSGHPNIIGIYMYNALPRRAWKVDMWTTSISKDSPVTFLVFGPKWGSKDGHAPDNVLPIKEAYSELGINSRFTLHQDMWGKFRPDGKRWKNRYSTAHYFPDLLKQIAQQTRKQI